MSGDILVPALRGQKGRQIDPKLDLWKYFEIAWLYDHIRFFVCGMHVDAYMNYNLVKTAWRKMDGSGFTGPKQLKWPKLKPFLIYLKMKRSGLHGFQNWVHKLFV